MQGKLKNGPSRSPRDLLCKVCGLTRPKDVALCHSLGVDFTGFIFVPGSPRRISPGQAAALPFGPGARTGVFSRASLEHIKSAAALARLDYIQLHGGESPEFCRDVGPERVIKVLWPAALSRARLLEELDRFAPVCAWFLFDAGSGGGGSGKTLDFAELGSVAPPRPWLLAGGLGPETLGRAFEQCSPHGVDMNSALERSPGVKDHGLLREAMALLNRPVR